MWSLTTYSAVTRTRVLTGSGKAEMRVRRTVSWFFFFQAEDGIRDGRVTGVQTCALPIYTVELARPGRVRTQITFNGQSFIQAYDGSTAWTVNPFGGSGAPEALPPAAAANVIAGGDFEGALVDYARKGNRVVLAGTDTADGKPAWKLVVTLPSGLVDNYYIDAASFLETKWEG